jgi:hypothetical protein
MSVEKLDIKREVKSRKMKTAVKNAFEENNNGAHLVITIRGSVSGLSIRAEPVEKDTLFVGGAVKRRAEGRFVNDHVIVQTQFKHKDMMNGMAGEPVYARFNGDDSWRIDPDGLTKLVNKAVDSGYAVQVAPETVVDLFDLYEEESTKTKKEGNSGGGGGGGVTPDVEAGECPACGKDCGGFKQLRGHIGGKVRFGNGDHENLGIKLEDYQ